MVVTPSGVEMATHCIVYLKVISLIYGMPTIIFKMLKTVTKKYSMIPINEVHKQIKSSILLRGKVKL